MTLIDFVMPSLGADMDSGTVTEWMIETGDTVGRGDIVAIVETDKADIDIEVWDDGTVTEILIPVGKPVAVGTPLARLQVQGPDVEPPRPIETPENKDGAEEPPVWPEVAEAAPAAEALPLTAAALETSDGAEPIRRPMPTEEAIPTTRTMPTTTGASPLARRLAKERGIDLATVTGTGPGGAVKAADLELGSTSTEPPELKPPPSESDAKVGDRSGTNRMRRAIGELLARSKREIPHYYLATDVDLEAMLSRLTETNGERPVRQRVLPAAVLIKAVAVAAAQHEAINGFWVDDEFRPAEGVHVGVAVALRGGGLVAPAIHNADELSVEELMGRLRDLVGRARSGRLRGSEMADPTLTVSNLGDRGVDLVHGVIYPPQVALVGVGRISKRPAVVGDSVTARRQVTISISADHRASDGQVGARFLNTVERLLQKPEELEA